MTGKREWPVVRAASMTEAADSRPSRNVTLTRGVRTSAAVRSPNVMLRATNRAVSSSIAPSCAERSTSDRSSRGERAERSSSCGSTPQERRMALAVPFSERIGHAIAVVNSRCGSWVQRAVAIGTASAMFLGISSPISIVAKVLIVSAEK